MNKEIIKNLLIRTVTIVAILIPAWYIFVYLPPLATSLALVIIASWILFVELPRLVDPKTWQFYLLALLYICFPIYLMIGINQHLFFRLYLISGILLVFIHDTSAYLVGTFFGRHKMAPDISPGKTWEGFVGGLIAVVAWNMYSIVVSYKMPIFSVKSMFFLGFSITFVALATFGDLFESWLKRRAGVKDSGLLLPGHGGVLDRLDSLLFVAPALCLYIPYMMKQAFPGINMLNILKMILLPKF